MQTLRYGLVLVVLSMVGCPPPPGGKTTPGGGAATRPVRPDACGKIDTNDVGRKMYAFLLATATLDREVTQLNRTARNACLAMAAELKLPATQTKGDTATVCKNVATAMRDDLAAAGQVSQESKFEVIYKPAECKVNMDVAAEVTASCEGTAAANVNVMCQGSCEGTCRGDCIGTCAVRGPDGKCAGQCTGTCKGGCSGTCDGAADVQADIECETAAEIRANLEATCTPAETKVVYTPTQYKNPEMAAMVERAVTKGLPGLLQVAAKVQGPVAQAVATWGKATVELFQSSGKLADALGDAAACVLVELGAAFAAVARIEVEVQVTVEASVEVGGACGAHS
jgi:hypothetical protein